MAKGVTGDMAELDTIEVDWTGLHAEPAKQKEYSTGVGKMISK